MQTANKPISVTILLFDQALTSAVTGAMDLFALAGVSWQRIHRQTPTPFFKVQLASLHGQSVTCVNQVKLTPHLAIDEVETTQILIVPTIGGEISGVLKANRNLLPFLQKHHRAGADIAGNCTGSFLLAEAGLLDQRVATTHWGYVDAFSQRYPKVLLQPEHLVTQQDNVFCAGGGMAWFDLTLLLIERYCGHQVASQTAKSHVLDMTRPKQSVYAGSRQRKYHQDREILKVQDYLEQHFDQPLGLEQLAHNHNMTPRTLLRKFKRACGQTPGQYMQGIRIEQARKLLETQPWSLDKVVHAVGYDDASSFTRLFKRVTGMSPSVYRSKFRLGVNS